MSNDVVFVGMDLGSFKTSVCCSNGRRETLPSVVGFPKDHIAKSVIGGEVAFGETIEANPLALEVVRPFGNGVLKFNDPQTHGGAGLQRQDLVAAAKALVRHAVAQVAGSSSPIYGVVGAPSRATLENKQVIVDAAQSAFDAVVVVPEPFAVAYGMDRLTNTLIIDIGAGTIDLCPMYGTYPADEDQVTIPIGGDHIDDRFAEMLHETYPATRVSRRMIRQIKEKYGCVDQEQARAIVVLPVDGVPKEFDVTDLLRQACQAIIPGILEGIKLLVARFDLEVQQTLLNNIIIAGGGSQLKGLDHLIEQSLSAHGGGNVTRAYDSVFAGAAGALKLAIELPLDNWSRLREEGSDEESSRAA